MLWGPDDWDAWTLDGARATPESTGRIETVRDVLRRLPRRSRRVAADLGCGRGTLLSFLSMHFERVIAIDYAPASLALARRACDEPNVGFRRRDLRDLTPFRNAFDVAVAIDSIVGPEIEDVDRILEQICRSLVEGGLLVATFPATAPGGEAIPLVRDGAAGPGGILRVHEIELQYRLRRAGFQGVRIRRMRGGDDPLAPTLLALAVRRALN